MGPDIFFEADKSGSGGAADDGNQGDNTDQGDSKPLQFDSWLNEQPDPVKAMLDGHTKGLKSALDSERENRKTLEKQLREMATKAEKGSEAETKLTQLADQMAEADRKADFYEAAHAEGVTNLKLAYLVATQDELFDRRGAVSFKSMKETYPELFVGTKPPKGDAGTGHEGQPGAKSMNDFIRRAAGRGGTD
jgi:hypothetical protein